MESLKLQTQVINLGKQLVKELGLEPGGDTFSRWLVHYIAEQMKASEEIVDEQEKKQARKECFETILKLWEHRWHFPAGRQPFGNFAPILKTLERLNPEEKEPFFLKSLDYELSELKKENPELKEVINCTTQALQIDKVARIWIDFFLKEAALKADNKKAGEFLKNSLSQENNEDAEIIKIILDRDLSAGEEIYEDDSKTKYKLERLNKRIEELEKFSKLNDFLLEHYRKELVSVQTN